jgi:hypothetical protein
MKIVWPVVVVASLVASSCASAGRSDARAPLQVLRACEVSCSGSIGSDRSDASPAQAPVEAAAPSDSPAPFRASVRLASVSQAQAGALLRSLAPGAGAFVVTTDSAERALGGSAGPIDGRPFATADREAGVVAVERAASFVASFDFTAADRSALFDPVIGVYTIGNRLTLRPCRNDGDGSWTVELALHSLDVDQPALNASVGVLGADTRIRFDVPILASVVTRTSATLARGESLVVVSPELLRGDRCVVAVVSPD